MPSSIQTNALERPVVEAETQNWIGRLVYAFSKQNTILVHGESGTGKSQFENAMTEMMPTPIDRMKRSQEIERSHIIIKDKPLALVVVPGQEQSKPKRAEAIRAALRSCCGVINVVAYGYHEGPTGTAEIFNPDDTVRDDFLSDRRQREIDFLSEWTSLLGGKENQDRFLITLVNKADIWWDKRDEVLEYYRKGPYHQALGDAKELKNIVLPFCATPKQKFYDKPIGSSNFDNNIYYILHSIFIETVFRGTSKLPLGYDNKFAGEVLAGQDMIDGLFREASQEEMLQEYHRLVDIKLAGSLTQEQASRLNELEEWLDEQDTKDPWVQEFELRSKAMHEAQMQDLRALLNATKEELLRLRGQ